MKERAYIEKRWREEKYHVLFHSQAYYDKIREMLKSNPTLEEVNDIIETAMCIPPTTGSILNAYDHMWGYFKKIATDEEKNQSKMLRQLFVEEQINYDELLNFLKALTIKYDIKYLKQSSILRER